MHQTFLVRSLTMVAAIVGVTIFTALPLHAGQSGQAAPPVVPANIQQAIASIKEGKTAEALAAVKLELQSNPTSARAANLLDTLGASADARVVFLRIIDEASDPVAKASAQRAMAVSYAFTADCRSAVKYEQLAMAYWATREEAEPQNAFFQQGEIANEAARICIDSGDLATAETWYRRGAELGLKEPSPQTHPRSLWQFRLAHALGRLAARVGDKAEAQRQIVVARAALDNDAAMAAQQERFFPYLVGYVAVFTNDLKTAEAELTKALAITGNQTDLFMQYLLALTYDKQGLDAKARELYAKVFNMAVAHNVPAAFVRRATRSKVPVVK